MQWRISNQNHSRTVTLNSSQSSARRPGPSPAPARLVLHTEYCQNLYTSHAFVSLNDPLRRPNGAHPFAVTVAFIAEGIKRLRVIGCDGTPLTVEDQIEKQPPLWRGLCNVRGELARTGGTELAPL